MISKTFFISLQKITTLLVVFVLIFGSNIASAQNYIIAPDGPPPGNNAPAPIHEGSTGQGKMWGSIPQYSLGSFLNIVEGLLSRWVIADGQGIAATQFCLGSDLQIATSGFSTDGTTTGLNCINATTGWPTNGQDGSDGSDGGPGGGGGDGDPGDGTTSSIPNGSDWHELLSFNNITEEWEPLPLVRIMSPLESYLSGSQSAFETIIQNGFPLPGSIIEFGSLNTIPYGNPAEINSSASENPFYDGSVQMTVTGSFTAQNDSSTGALHTLSLSGLGTRIVGPLRIQHTQNQVVPVNNILATTSTNGQTAWKSAAELGLLSQADLSNFITQEQWDLLNQLIQNLTQTVAGLASIPSGTQTGQMLYWWNNQWNLTDGVYGTASLFGVLDGGLMAIAPGGTFAFLNNSDCPAGANGNVTTAQSYAFPGFPNSYKIRCNGGIKIGNFFTGSDDDTVVVSNIAQLDDQQIVTTQPRNLCYTTVGITGVTEGLLVDCEAMPSGELIVNGPVPDSGPMFNDVDDYTIETWPVPTGIDSVTIRACAGGGGGGGGAAGLPGNMDKPGGGGGGGGGAGACTNQTVSIESNVTALRITVGRGGNFGDYGERVCGSSNQSINSCGSTQGTGGNGEDGQAGLGTKIEKLNNAGTVLSTPINLVGGTGGKAGRIQCSIGNSGSFVCGTMGGPGGNGGNVPTTGQTSTSAQAFQNYNGEHGRESDENDAGTPTLNSFFGASGYFSGLCNNITSNGSTASCGGDGGDGKLATYVHPELSTPYINSSEAVTGQGGLGGHGCGGCNGHFEEAWQGDEITSYPTSGTWASGGGGGAGAYGWTWIDYNNGSGFEYRNRGGSGRRGGPGFVRITW